PRRCGATTVSGFRGSLSTASRSAVPLPVLDAVVHRRQVDPHVGPALGALALGEPKSLRAGRERAELVVGPWFAFVRVLDDPHRRRRTVVGRSLTGHTGSVPRGQWTATFGRLITVFA